MYILKCINQTIRLKPSSCHILNTYELKVTKARKVVMSGRGLLTVKKHEGTLRGAGDVYILNCMMVTWLYKYGKTNLCTYVLNALYYMHIILPKIK